jgi:amino acid transporter
LDDKLTGGETEAEEAGSPDGARPENGGERPAADTKAGAQHKHEVRIIPSRGQATDAAQQRTAPSAPAEQEQSVAKAAETRTDAAPSGGAAEAPGPADNVVTNEPLTPTAAPHKVKADLRTQEVVRGSHPGDRYVRYDRSVGPFRRKGGGVLAASIEAGRPRSGWGRFWNSVKRVLIGTPLSTEQSLHERLTNVKALAVLSSDALSSVAYATEEILRILLLAGTAALAWALPLAGAVAALMVIVVSSYRQTIAAYPRGGGTYIVAKDNLGTLPGLAAASSILLGYILTVAVSVAAGIAAVYSLFPALRPYRVEICLAVIAFVTISNLRGLREAGNIFAVPTYLFIAGILALIGYGLLRMFFGVGGEMVYDPPAQVLTPDHIVALDLVLLMRAFTQGAAALTGVEAIADGVPAFKPPEASNARRTLLYMAAIAITMFLGITFFATRLGIIPSEDETVVSQIARTVFGENVLWVFIQIATALILVLAANTAFADFPRLSYFLARDKFMPHQYSFRGDRLAFSWGIVTLAVLAGILVVVYDGDTSALIPLYAIGVFSAFTFSQTGMVVRWWRTRPPGWWRNLIMNAIGAVTTFVVFLVATITKLEQGTWIVLLLIPVQMGIFLAINRHYARVAREIRAVAMPRRTTWKHTFIVPVSSLNSISLSALDYARSLSSSVTAVHIVEGEETEEAERFHEEWRKVLPNSDISLVIIESPYRSLIGPLLSYVDALDRQYADDTITIVLPEFLPRSPWEYLLHNQSALRLKAALLFRPNTVVADMPYHLGRESAESAAALHRSPLLSLPWAAILLAAIIIAILYFAFLSP